MTNQPYSHIMNSTIDQTIIKMEEEVKEVRSSLEETSKEMCEESTSIHRLQERLQSLYDQMDVENPYKFSNQSPYLTENIEKYENSKVNRTLHYAIDELSPSAIVISCIAGGLGVLVDFLIVRIPQNTKIKIGNTVISKEGSVLTEWMKKIGFTKGGNTSAWIKILEKYFKVNFDTSIIKGETGFCPRSHRLYNLAHDPSISGFLWALKDTICGTMSFIDKNGNLKVIKTSSSSLFKKLFIPIIWIGHIISDIFTKAGIPIPGSSFLRVLQVGSFGEKSRSIAEIIEYMYYKGYDLRHLVSMSSVNAVIEFIIRVYDILTRENLPTQKSETLKNIYKEMHRIKLEKMRLCSYAIAVSGNVVKLASYGWNPLALNLPVWLSFLRQSISVLEYKNSTTAIAIELVKNREKIENDFNRIEAKLKDL